LLSKAQFSTDSPMPKFKIRYDAVAECDLDLKAVEKYLNHGNGATPAHTASSAVCSRASNTTRQSLYRRRMESLTLMFEWLSSFALSRRARNDQCQKFSLICGSEAALAKPSIEEEPCQKSTSP
jgi:hypothetical protein